jgi:hypothetical protein
MEIEEVDFDSLVGTRSGAPWPSRSWVGIIFVSSMAENDNIIVRIINAGLIFLDLFALRRTIVSVDKRGGSFVVMK